VKYTYSLSNVKKVYKNEYICIVAFKFKLKKRVEYSDAVLVEELVIEGWTALFFRWP
jgi:hypothetical protein